MIKISALLYRRLLNHLTRVDGQLRELHGWYWERRKNTVIERERKALIRDIQRGELILAVIHAARAPKPNQRLILRFLRASNDWLNQDEFWRKCPKSKPRRKARDDAKRRAHELAKKLTPVDWDYIKKEAQPEALARDWEDLAKARTPFAQ